MEATQALAQPERIFILGSSSLLPEYPNLGEPGQPLEASYDSDLLLRPVDEEIAAMLGEAIGQQSLFARRNGYYADILRPAIVESLPPGWESRLHPVSGYANVFALDIYDLALVKLMVGRTKDLELVRALLRLGLLKVEQLRSHYQQCPLGEHAAIAAGRNFALLVQEIGDK